MNHERNEQSAHDEAPRSHGHLATAVENAAVKAGDGLQGAARSIRESAPTEGFLSTAATAVARGLEYAGSSLRRTDLDHVRSGVEEAVRRHPLEALLIGAGIGFAIARTLRSR